MLYSNMHYAKLGCKIGPGLHKLKDCGTVLKIAKFKGHGSLLVSETVPTNEILATTTYRTCYYAE